MSKNTGGLPVLTVPYQCNIAKSFRLSLLSDFHLGAAACDVDMIHQELDRAWTYQNRILLGGDLLDLVLPGDLKRFNPTVLAPRLQGRTDIINEALNWLEEILAPVASAIDVVFPGNHETYIEKKLSFDPSKEIVERLRKYNPNIQYGNYTSYVIYQLPKKQTYTIWFTHGGGAVTTTAKALKNLLDVIPVFEADLYWSGHYHCRANCSEQRLKATPEGPVAQDVRCVLTGSYLKTYGHQSQTSVTGRGKISNYGADGAMRPHGIGGAEVELCFDNRGRVDHVEVIQ